VSIHSRSFHQLWMMPGKHKQHWWNGHSTNCFNPNFLSHLNIQQTKAHVFNNVSNIQPTTNRIIPYPKKALCIWVLETWVFESIKILFDVIESLFKGERRIKSSPTKFWYDKKIVEERKTKKQKTLETLILIEGYVDTCAYLDLWNKLYKKLCIT